MTPILVHLQPYDDAASARIDVRLGDAPNAEAYGLGGVSWAPYITERPVSSLELMSPDLDGRVQAGRARLSFNPLAIAGVAKRQIKWKGAIAKIYSAKALAWPAITEFDGLVIDDAIDEDGLVTLTMEVTTDFLEGPLLIAEYTGGGGATGEAAMRGVLKPAGFGTVENIEPVWFDTTRWIGCIDGYGNTSSITKLMEGLDDRGARTANYANYAALAAAIDGGSVPPGRWATCVAEGLVGLGAPPLYPIGVNATFGTNRIGSMMTRILQTHRGVLTANIDVAAFAAMDAACPYDTAYWTKEQRDIKDLIEAMAGSINATPIVTFQNKVTITRGVTTAAVAELIRSGRTTPRVIKTRRISPPAPVYRLRARTGRPANVLTYDQVLYEDTIEDKGLYSAGSTYRKGHVVWKTDKSSWLYINATPTAGNAPPNWPTTSNAYWQNMTPPSTASNLTYADGTPLENLKPAQLGANVTQTNTAAAIAGQGSLATMDSVSGTNIDPGSITLYNLAASPGNLIQNSDFATGDFTGWRRWSNPSWQAVIPRATAGVPANAPSANVMRYQFTGAAAGVSTFAATLAYSDIGSEQDGFAAIPGEQYLAQIHVARNSAYAASANFVVIVYFKLADGSTTPAITTINADLGALAANTWFALSGQFTAPANAVRGWLYVFQNSFSAGAMFWTNLFCDRMRGERDLRSTAVRLGVNVVRADGSTSVTDSTAITALGTAAAITGQGPGATASAEETLNWQYVGSGTSGVLKFDGTPGGGLYSNGGGTITGMLRIDLPQPLGNTMLQFEVDVFDYENQSTVRYIIAGYTATGGWTRTSAHYIGPETKSKRVRFGISAGGKACVWLGEPSSTWLYPKVAVHNLQIGHTNQSLANWSTGWVIGIYASIGGTATFTIDKPRPGDTVFGEGIFEGPGGALATNNNYKTILGTAAAFSGQGTLATKNFVGAADVVTPSLAALSAEMGNVLIDSGSLVVSNGTFMKVIANGFGTANQFMEWYGPAMSLSACSEANAITYLKTNGDAYFGGSLSAGTLTNSGQTSSLTTTASVVVGPFGTNGNPIVVAASWAYSQTINKTYAADSTGLSQFNADVATYNATSSNGSNYSGSVTETVASSTLTLARKIGTGSFANVATGSNTSRTATFTGTKPVVGDSPGNSTIRSSATISFTYTDNAGGALDREFQATLSRGWSFGSGTIAQRVAIVATEE